MGLCIMLNALDRLNELGFRQPGVESPGYSAARIQELDWARLENLLRALVIEAGCEVAGVRVNADASVHFGMVEHPGSGLEQRVLVKLAAWNEWGAQLEHVEAFAGEVRQSGVARGILVAPSGFSQAAGEAGRRLGIEMVDAAKLEGVLRRLPANRGEFLWNPAFDGDAHAPTCPVCLGKLVLKDTALDHSGPAGEERGFSQDAIISEPVHCRLLRVVRGVEVQFLQQARAQEMEIEGIAHGDLVCEGTLWMGPTPEVNATVDARAVRM